MDQNCTSSEKAQYVGRKRKLCENYVLNMALMLNALTELEHLSLKLQEQKVSYIASSVSSDFSEILCVAISDSKPR
jgi:hypothetical protein